MEKVLINQNYFECFGLKMEFDISVDDLDHSYFKLQAKNHPDCNHNSENKSAFEVNSVFINEAYHTLQSPLKRAEYLLSLLLKKYDVIKPTQELLLEVMEMREKAKNEDPFLNTAYQDCMEEIKKSFAMNDIMNMAHFTMKLKYIAKIKSDICN